MKQKKTRKGWLIYSGDHLWDDLVYRSEAAALRTVEQCNVPDARVVEASR